MSTNCSSNTSWPAATLELVATIGPSSRTPELLAAMRQAGATAFRINLAHAGPAWLGEVFAHLRQLFPEGGSVPVLPDLPGAKPRTGPLALPLVLERGERVVLGRSSAPGRVFLPVDWSVFNRRPAAGDTLLLRDGRLQLRVMQAGEHSVQAVVEQGGEVTGRMGLALAGTGDFRILQPFSTATLELCRQAGLERFLLSFCDTTADLAGAEAEFRRLGFPAVSLWPKLETRPAIDNVSAILDAAPGACLARGDLGTQLDPAELPAAEIRVLAAGRRAGKPVLLAGEVFYSLMYQPRPVRAELSAAWYALAGGAAGFVLSDETATGPNPVMAVAAAAGLLRQWQAGLDSGTDSRG